MRENKALADGLLVSFREFDWEAVKYLFLEITFPNHPKPLFINTLTEADR